MLQGGSHNLLNLISFVILSIIEPLDVLVAMVKVPEGLEDGFVTGPIVNWIKLGKLEKVPLIVTTVLAVFVLQLIPLTPTTLVHVGEEGAVISLGKVIVMYPPVGILSIGWTLNEYITLVLDKV